MLACLRTCSIPAGRYCFPTFRVPMLIPFMPTHADEFDAAVMGMSVGIDGFAMGFGATIALNHEYSVSVLTCPAAKSVAAKSSPGFVVAPKTVRSLTL